VVLEAIEVSCPKLAIFGEPVVELCERLRPDAVEAALRVGAHIDESRLFEDAEMFGHGGLADAEPVDELADRSLSLAEQIEDRQPARFSEDLECGESGQVLEYA
jgi:hypothetical protein